MSWLEPSVTQQGTDQSVWELPANGEHLRKEFQHTSHQPSRKVALRC